jgi:hypothetical protein
VCNVFPDPNEEQCNIHCTQNLLPKKKMGILMSPVVLGGIAIIAILTYHLYSSSIEKKRYVNLGAGPPKILPSNTFG